MNRDTNESGLDRNTNREVGSTSVIRHANRPTVRFAGQRYVTQRQNILIHREQYSYKQHLLETKRPTLHLQQH